MPRLVVGLNLGKEEKASSVLVAGLRAAGLRSSHLGTLIDERLGSKTLIAILGRCWQQAAKAGVAPAI